MPTCVHISLLSEGKYKMRFGIAVVTIPGPKSWLPNVLRRIQDVEPNRSQRV
jgi:hypothetical protein